MKKFFFEYHIDEYFEEIFNKGIIVLDTNSLLNLYRFSKETRDKYLEILSTVENRLFLTYHIGLEFYRNRYTLINNRMVFKSELKDYLNDYLDKLLNIIKNTSSNSKHDNSLNILKHEDELKNNIIKELEKAKNKINKHLKSFKEDIDLDFVKNEDPVLSEIEELFVNKISSRLSDDEIQNIYKEGRDRYKKLIPPGYKDDVEKPEPDKYSDLIIWRELEKIAKNKEKNILFVSDDRKEDWAASFKGKDLGPRKELIKEFYKNTQKVFYSITTKKFINLISEKYNVKDTETLEKETELIYEIPSSEIANLRKLHEDIRKQQEFLRESMKNPFAEWMKEQEFLRESMKNPFAEWMKEQELLSKKLNKPIEDINKGDNKSKDIKNNNKGKKK